jgi:hypothetical protein
MLGYFVDRSTSRHNYPYLNRAHTVTPAYAPENDDRQISIIDEIATKRPSLA